MINKFNQNLKTFKDSYNFNQIPLIKKKVIQIIEIFEYKKEKELIKVEGSFIKYLKKRKEKIEKEGCEIKKEIEHQRLKTY
ncbi:MAG: hypothetical protein GW795_07490, partial [Cyanobacteria bacterium]|nr:hypothetical protein [Cyanobacteria bacterium CG_2015-04_32_10]